MASDKIIERIEKLLRRAAPDSGSAKNEIEVASVEIVKLILEHGISLRPSKAAGVSKDAWVLSLAPYHAGCQICGGMISPRDAVWIRVTGQHQIQFRHNYGGCAVTA